MPPRSNRRRSSRPRGLAAFRGRATVATWLTRLALNAARDHPRRKRTRDLLDQVLIHRRLLAQQDQGHAVGLLDGTMADLSNWFGMAENSPGWIQPGGSCPVFALVQHWRCEGTGNTGSAQKSEWLSLGFWVAVSRGAATHCGARPGAA
jgi:hypothetical protein